MSSPLLIALGGNALIKKGQAGTIDEQFENLKTPLADIARLSKDHKIILTHGNGPQVGNLLLQQECCNDVPRLPLEILVAQTEGQIGYMIESTLDGELMRQVSLKYVPTAILSRQTACHSASGAMASTATGPFVSNASPLGIPGKWPPSPTASIARRNMRR